MKSRTGGVPRAMASVTVIVPAIAGSIASARTFSATGAMMNIVKKSDRPIRIWFDGISCVPSACRRK